MGAVLPMGPRTRYKAAAPLEHDGPNPAARWPPPSFSTLLRSKKIVAQALCGLIKRQLMNRHTTSHRDLFRPVSIPLTTPEATIDFAAYKAVEGSSFLLLLLQLF